MRLYVTPSIHRLLIWIDPPREQSTSTLALHPEEVALFVQMFDYLAVVSGGGKGSGQTVPNEQHIEALIHVLDRWPAIHRFPRAQLLLYISPHRSSIALFYSDRPRPTDRGFCPAITAHESGAWRSVYGCSTEGIGLGRTLDAADDET
jgi:hypothetical protein